MEHKKIFRVILPDTLRKPPSWLIFIYKDEISVNDYNFKIAG